ncbi:MAG: ATP-binding cassette domain-containing protein [Gammaproteobacteria bacterium]|nr:ATP-binding cassette domain-containing protein [Gammaproteobacteria bacterium]
MPVIGQSPQYSEQPLLEVRHLDVRFTTPEGEVKAVDDLEFSLVRGETLGVVGESGSGKTQVAHAMLGLLAENGRATGSVRFAGEEILNLPAKRLNRIRGAGMALVFQDPMTSLNPYLRIGPQLSEALMAHEPVSGRQAREAACSMLDAVHLAHPRACLRAYPHELSGGMRQRVMIAMALICRPRVLIADEPSTALDATVQARILELLSELKREFELAMLLITHDLGVVAGTCDRVLIMYGGRTMEEAAVDDIFYRSQHPYTRGLLGALPRLDAAGVSRMAAIPGQPPSLLEPQPGCPFEKRCDYRFEPCKHQRPPLENVSAGHRKACHHEKLP